MTSLRFFLLLAAVLFQVGCASDTTPSSDDVDANGNRVSSKPWNTPEPWETQGQLGSAMGQ